MSALIVPNFINLKDWCVKNGVNVGSNADIIKDAKVKQLFRDAIDEKNKFFGQWETLKRFELMADEWTVEGGELTPTMKVKRKVVTEKYAKQIEELYA